MKKIKTIKLYKGIEIPKIWIGTYSLNHFQLVKVLLAVTHYGYRLIDTTRGYSNEPWIGRSFLINPIDRNRLFVTTESGN
jgi:diketogulonate reductase-like aldo/keto reductase